MTSFLGLVSEPVTAPRSVARVSLNIFWPSRRSTHVPSKSEVCCATHILMAKIKIAPRMRLKRSASIQSDYVKKPSPSDDQLLGLGERASNGSAFGCESELEYILAVKAKHPRSIEIRGLLRHAHPHGEDQNRAAHEVETFRVHPERLCQKTLTK